MKSPRTPLHSPAASLAQSRDSISPTTTATTASPERTTKEPRRRQQQRRTWNPDLARLPSILVLPSHLSVDRQHDVQGRILIQHGRLTHDSARARLFVGNITHPRRAVLDLRNKGVWTEIVASAPGSNAGSGAPAGRAGAADDEGEDRSQRPHKRARVDRGVRLMQQEDQDEEADGRSSSTESSLDSDADSSRASKAPNDRDQSEQEDQDQDAQWAKIGTSIKVVRLAWLEESEKQCRRLPLGQYLICECRRVSPPAGVEENEQEQKRRVDAGREILQRAEAEAGLQGASQQGRAHYSSSSNSRRGPSKNSQTSSQRTVARLLRQSTSEHDYLPDAEGEAGERAVPDWVQRGSVYSCERATPMHGPNEAFVEELKRIRLARILLSDEIGVRAYSTAIAAVAAYPYAFRSPKDILSLPGCESKIAALWVEFIHNYRAEHSGGTGESGTSPAEEAAGGYTQAARDAGADEKLRVLRLFYEVWGVGAKTAQEFYSRGWRDLDDVVEFGWAELSRVQQIGVKFYDEFGLKMGRAEVEQICAVVHGHAQRLRPGFEAGVRTCIVGGYRRGKQQSGDADIIVSHVDERQTLDLVTELVDSLVEDGWVTHELITHTSGTRRGQATVPFSRLGGGHGFDSLDKALMVWQDRSESGQEPARERGDARPHRRVDIIVAPWTKIGCAVLGWTADTTFERDLRRYANKRRGWKFDSSGIRDRRTGLEVALPVAVPGQRAEGPEAGPGTGSREIEQAERGVFELLGLPYREPWERCTG